jgi:hypothetical protein
MRSVEARFKKVQKKEPYWSDYVCLAEATQGQKFTRRRIYYHFFQLVAKDDYQDKDVNKLVRHLWKNSNSAEECTFLSEIAPGASIIDEHEVSIITTFTPPILVAKQ